MANSRYNTLLKNKIQGIVIDYVLIENVLHLFHQYDTGVLTDIDIDNIRAEAYSKGKKLGTILLLERLPRYQNWFECLTNVLKDPEVKLQFVADHVECLKAELDQDLRSSRGFSPGTPGASVTTLNAKSLLGTAAVSDFSLPQNGGDIETDAVGKLEPHLPRDLKNNGSKEEDAEPATSADVDSTRVPSDNRVVKGRLTDKTDESNKSSCGQQDFPSEGASPPVPDGSRIPVSSKVPELRKARQRRVTYNETECDNYKEEVTAALGQLPGWHTDFGVQDVWRMLTHLKNEDGWYLLWYHDFEKKPVISVTDKNTVTAVKVRKKPDPKDTSKVLYFVSSTQKTTNSLLDLVRYHLENGIKELSRDGDERIILFKRPVLSQDK